MFDEDNASCVKGVRKNLRQGHFPGLIVLAFPYTWEQESGAGVAGGGGGGGYGGGGVRREAEKRRRRGRGLLWAATHRV